MRKIFTFLAAITLLFTANNTTAQNKTLFDYPIAPDSCTSLESRCDYSTAHFWDKFDFHKQLNASQDSLVIATMYDFLQILSNANLNVGKSAIRLLMNRAQTNQSNFLKLMQAAEYLLYANTSQTLIDDVYLAFLQSATEASWMKKDIKAHYTRQATTINNTKLGEKLYNFAVVDANGAKKKIHDVPIDSAEIVLVFITNDGNNSAIARTRLSVDLGVNELLSTGEAKVLNVYCGAKPKEFLAQASQYPDWTLLTATDSEILKLDMRMMPNFIVLDNRQCVMNKNITVDIIKQAFSR